MVNPCIRGGRCARAGTQLNVPTGPDLCGQCKNLPLTVLKRLLDVQDVNEVDMPSWYAIKGYLEQLTVNWQERVHTQKFLCITKDETHYSKYRGALWLHIFYRQSEEACEMVKNPREICRVCHQYMISTGSHYVYKFEGCGTILGFPCVFRNGAYTMRPKPTDPNSGWPYIFGKDYWILDRLLCERVERPDELCSGCYGDIRGHKKFREVFLSLNEHGKFNVVLKKEYYLGYEAPK